MKTQKHYLPQPISDKEKLPQHIREQIQNVMKKALGEYADEKWHVSYLIYDIEKVLDFRNSYKDKIQHTFEVVPKYRIHHVYVDPNDNKTQYAFDLNLDEYGQILKFDLPVDKPDATIPALNGKQAAIDLAIIYAKRKGYNPKVMHAFISHNKQNDVLLWNVWLGQSLEKDKKVKIWQCRVISLDIFNRCVFYDRKGAFSKQRPNMNCITVLELEKIDG